MLCKITFESPNPGHLSGIALTMTSKSLVNSCGQLLLSMCYPGRVTPSNLGACLNSLAYMCFYVKRHLDYKPYTTPSYVLTRETEAVREKEMEKEKEAARMKEVEDALLATV